MSISVEETIGGTRVVVLRKDLEAEDYSQDPNFFDSDYSIAAATAWVVWDATRDCVTLLRQPDSWVCARLRGARVLELGAGTGFLGLCVAAATGAHVLVSDVATVVAEVLRPNLALNAAPDVDDEAQAQKRWRGAVTVGAGSVAAQPLDWMRPVGEQLAPCDPRDADVILAAECVWLQELVDPFVETVCALLRSPRRPVCVLVFRERAVATSQAFTRCAAVVAEFGRRGVVAAERGTLGEDCKAESATRFYELVWPTVES